MQLKAQNPTQGNEAIGTKQPAPERVDGGNGAKWLQQKDMAMAGIAKQHLLLLLAMYSAMEKRL